MHSFEILLELVKFGAKLLSLCFDLGKSFLSFAYVVNVELSLSFCEFGLVRWAQLGKILSSQPSGLLRLFSQVHHRAS